VDWIIVAVFIVGLAWIAAYTRRYTRSVSDFLSANRCAGRYLLTMAEGIAGLGIATLVANFEKFYTAGFAANWWGQMMAPLGLIAALSGWVNYRYRETRALTMAQFFEMRYSRKFRIYSGVLCWVSGILNYGICPAIVARLLIYFCGLPLHFAFGGMTIQTFPFIIAVEMLIALFFTFCSGMIAVMITDFLQAQFTNIVFVIVLFLLMFHFPWDSIYGTLSNVPPTKSMMNPFDQSGISDFNWVFFAIFGFKIFYSRMAWQGTQGYNAAAKSPHEAKMANILAEWRNGVTYLIIMLMPVCAYVVMHNADYSDIAAKTQATLGTIDNVQYQKQMIVPITLTHLFPVGILGIFVASMIGMAIGRDDTELHSWGSIFIQDVVMPFRKSPFDTVRHLWFLRASVVGVAVFAGLWSCFFPLHDNLFMYFFLTGTIYMGGAGAVIIGGLYWKKGTTQAAWAAMTSGLIMAVLGMLSQTLWPYLFKDPANHGWMQSVWNFLEAALPGELGAMTGKFPINGAVMAMISYVLAIVLYVPISLLTCRQDHDMDRLLHRGDYAAVEGGRKIERPATGWKALIPSAEFTRGDKFIYWFKIGWTAFFTITFIIGCMWAMVGTIPLTVWGKWWLFTVILSIVIGIVTTIWFLIGGFHDMFQLFALLRGERVNLADDGWVKREGDDAKETRAESADGASIPALTPLPVSDIAKK
jgi:SSS family solute:Na+ symporter